MLSTFTKRALIVAGGAAIALAGSAAAKQDFVGNTSADTRACFETRKMENYAPTKVGDADAVNIRVTLEGVYQLELASGCPSIAEADGLLIRTRNGSRLLCTGGEADLVVVGGFGGNASCSVSGVRKLNDGEIASLGAAATP